MSRSILLVKFKDDTILHGTYYGTSSSLAPWLFTDEDLDNKDVFDLCNDKDTEYHEKHGTCYQKWYPKDSENEEIIDEEDVEIFIEYGGGSCLLGRASKSKGLILSSLYEPRYWEENKELDEVSKWVFDYYIKTGKSTLFLGV